MIPIVSIVGCSGSGKTTFLERLIPALRGRGYRIGALKHDVHGFEMDHEGKDTWRHRKAGACAIAISSPSRLALIRELDQELSVDVIAARYFAKDDLLLTEGYKRLHYPKIEVFRAELERKPLCGAGDNLMAIVSDDPVETEVPVFPVADVAAVAAMIEERFLLQRRRSQVEVYLDGRKLPMKDFVQDFLVGGIQGMLSSLRGYEAAETMDIHIRVEGRRR